VRLATVVDQTEDKEAHKQARAEMIAYAARTIKEVEP
jgi:hypothetical protein